MDLTREERAAVRQLRHAYQQDIDYGISVLLQENRELKIRIAALEAENAELEAAQRQNWIPVSERLPEYHERVVFFGGGEMTTHIGYYVPELPQWTAEDGGYYHGKNAALITHWMPLPEPPEGA